MDPLTIAVALGGFAWTALAFLWAKSRLGKRLLLNKLDEVEEAHEQLDISREGLKAGEKDSYKKLASASVRLHSRKASLRNIRARTTAETDDEIRERLDRLGL